MGEHFGNAAARLTLSRGCREATMNPTKEYSSPSSVVILVTLVSNYIFQGLQVKSIL